MEEFFLSLLFSFYKLDIINKKNVEFTVFVSENSGLILFDSSYILMCEHFRRNVKYLCFRIITDYLNSDGLHEMSLSETGSSVNEKRIVDISRRFSYCNGYGMSILI